MKTEFNFILSGGGTGGHIFPAIAIANELKAHFPKSKFLFIGAKGRMEMQKVAQEGYEIEGLWISGFQRKLTVKNLTFPFKLISSIIKSREIIKRFKPDIVIGTGGFASGPMLYVASKRNIPCLIQEQNSLPGITNRMLGKSVNKICVAYDGLETYFQANKLVKTGNPLRKQFFDYSNNQVDSKSNFKLKHNYYTLLIIGGSLGSRRINELIESKLDYLTNNNIEIIWQCGGFYYPEYKKYNDLKNVKVYEFIRDMHKAYAAADIIISRAGALSVSELCMVGKPVIFIPSPNVAADHQTKNAEALVTKNAAILIKEQDLEARFEFEFNALLGSEEKRNQLSLAIKSLAIPDATQRIVSEVKKLINVTN